MRKVVAQSIWLTIVFLILPAGFMNLGYYIILPLGLISLRYLKKYSREEILKINIISSFFAFVIPAVILLIPSSFDRDNVLMNMGCDFPLSVPCFITAWTFEITNIDNFLHYAPLTLILFNVPFLVYYFFGKKDEVVVPQVVDSIVQVRE